MPRSKLLNLLGSEAHVWLALADKHSDPGLLAWYRDMLSEEEHERYRSFHFTRDRGLYLLSHGCLRVALSRYLKTTPDKFAFTRNRHGRPELVRSDGDPPVRFSVSHSAGLVACLIVLSIDAGVDVEKIRRLDNLETFSGHVFTPLEISMLRGLPENERIERFFTLWTLKEAYLKARGTGLSLPLKHFAFCFDAGGRVHISTDAQLHDIPSSWQFESCRPSGSHAVSMALRRGDGEDLRVRFFEAVPRRDGGSIPCLDLKQYGLEDIDGLEPEIAVDHRSGRVEAGNTLLGGIGR